MSALGQSSDEPRTPAVLQRSLEPRAEAARCARSQPLLGTFNLFTWKTPPQTTTTVDSNNRLRHASIVVFGERREHPRQQLMRPLLYLIEWWQMSISTLGEEQIRVWRWFNISRPSRWVDLARARSCSALIIAFMSRQDHYHCRPTGPVYCSSTVQEMHFQSDACQLKREWKSKLHNERSVSCSLNCDPTVKFISFFL